MALTKKLRFEVFKRDGFICQYCGERPPNVILEIDHIKPKSKDGADDINNLVTSCFDCNRGKKNIELTRIPSQLSENKEIIAERENQYNEYQKLMRKIDQRRRKEEDGVSSVYEKYFENYELLDKFKRGSVRKFIDKLGFIEVKNSMESACIKVLNYNTYNIPPRDAAIKYFCGICWNKIRETNNG